jgi:type I restriction enzyme S subunit
MSHIDDLITAHCPGGVEFKRLGDVVRIKNGKDHKALGDGDFPVYGSGGIMRYVDTYAYNKPSVLIPRKGSLGNLFYVDVPFWNVDTIFYTEIDEAQIRPKFLYYFLTTAGLGEMNQAGGVPSQTQSVLSELQIPVPPLELQRRIVRVLDTFTDITAELTAELTARKKQYNHYRDELLRFEGAEVEWKPLCEIGEFIRGKRFTKADFVDDGIDAIHYGEIYTRYGAWTDHAVSKVRSDMEGSLRYAKPNDVVIAGVGETVEDVGKAVAWIGAGSVAIHDDSYAFRHSMNPKYISYAMQTAAYISEKAKHVSRGKINRLLIDGVAKVRIPIPYPSDVEKSLAEQARIVAILDKFNALTNSITEGLPKEIELRQKQYEHYRDLLLSFPKPRELAA